MPINFKFILRDCFNFVRNQTKFFSLFSALFALESLTFSYLLMRAVPENWKNFSLTQNNLDLPQIALPDSLFFLVLLHFLCNLILYALSMVKIQQLTQHKNNLNQLFAQVSQRLIGLFILNLLIFFPFLLGLVDLFLALMSNHSVSAFSFLSFLLGLFIFIRFNLIFVDYVTTRKTLKENLQSMWQQGTKRTFLLSIYCIINYLFFGLLINNLSAFAGDNFISLLLSTYLSSAVYVFSLIFSFRFYTCFMQTPNPYAKGAK